MSELDKPADKPVTKATPAVAEPRFNFDTLPVEAKDWGLPELRRQIANAIDPVRLDKEGCTPTSAKRVHTSVLDTAVGGKWETMVGQPFLRVATRAQLERVYTVASNLYGDQRDAFIKYLEARYKALRG